MGWLHDAMRVWPNMQMCRTVLMLLLTAHHGLVSWSEWKQLLSTVNASGSALPSTALDVKHDRTRETETKFLRPNFETERVETKIQALIETQPQRLASIPRPRPNHGDQYRAHNFGFRASLVSRPRPCSIDRIQIQINSESGLELTGRSNGLDSCAWSSVTSLLFAYVGDVGVTSFYC